MTRISSWIFVATLLCVSSSFAQSVGTALVRNAPQLNGTVDGNLQEMTGKSVTLNGSAIVTGDLLVVGTPSLQINGTPNFGGVIVGTGGAAPSNYKVTLNGSVSLGRLRTRTDALALPVLPPVPSPTGTRNVAISAAGQSIGDFATLRNLTLNGNVGQYEVPPGTFGDFIANGGSGFTLGVAGSSQPAVYNLQHLTLNGQTNLLVVGPVVINLANGFTANGASGTSTNSSWLKINMPSGGLTLNGGSTVYGYVTAPNGTVIINGNAKLVGGAVCNALTVNGNALLQLFDITDFENHAPIASDQAVTTDEGVAKAIVLAATDPDGQALTYTVVSSPAHGALDGTPPTLTFTPVPGFSGTDTFTFRANDGQSESNVATVSITVAHVNHPPTAEAQTLILDQNGSAAFALVGNDVDGDSLTFRVTSMPAHGALSGVAPNLTYTPVQDFYGSDSLDFVVNDGAIDSSSAVVSISVNHVNHPPIAIGQNVILDEDTTKAISLTGTDADGDTLSFAIVAQPQHGTLSGSAPNLVYTPAPDYFGSDSFTFRVNDGFADSESATVNISVTSFNDPPSVAILTPAGGSQFDAGDTIHITATASDKDGSIAILRLLLDGGVISEQQQGTATFDSLDAAAGDHTITAIAVDNQGASTTSIPVLISVRDQENGPVQVNAGPDLLISLPATAHLDGAVTVNGVPAGQDVQLAWQGVSGPGNATFDNSAALKPIVSFDVPGDYVLKLVATAPEGAGFDSLKVTVLAAPLVEGDAPISNQGREFWMTFLSQHAPFFEPDHAEALLIISSETQATGTVEISETYLIDGAWQTYRTTEPFSIEAGKKTKVTARIPLELDDNQFDQALPTAIHILANAPVAVHGLYAEDYTTDGSLILPNGLLGQDHFLMSYRNSPSFGGDGITGGTQLAVVATKDQTQVTITPTAATPAHPANQSFTVTLQQGEVYRMINRDDAEADFTGTRVQSDKPVAVFSGHLCATVPATTLACDHLYEQIPPVVSWGRHFVTLPLKTRTGGDRFRVLAAHDATTVSIDGEIVASLDHGQFYETVLSQPASILANQGILLAQFAQSSGVDQTRGDPFLMLVPPYENFGRHYILGTQSLYSYYTDSELDPYDSYLSIVVDSAHTAEVTVNGQPIVAAEFLPIGESDFSGASLSVPKDSTIEVSAPVPLGAWIYGWAAYESYGFTGGMYGAIENATASLQLTQTADAALVGSVHHVRAALLSAAGLPVQDARVDFSVGGANPSTSSGLTSADGTVEFSWQGTQVGIDSVTATCGALSANASVTWVSPGGNQPPQVNAGPDVLTKLGEPLALHGVAQDDGLPAGGSLTLQWSTLPGLGDVTFSDPGSGETTANFIYPGQYTLRLTAYDGQFPGEDELIVTVDSPPIFNAVYPSSDSVDAGKEWSVAVSAEDRDGLIARIDLIEGEQILATLEPGRQVVFYYQTVLATVFTVPGSHSLSVRLTDDQGASTDRAIDVSVRPAPAVQILTPADHSTVMASDLIAFTASASSPGGSITRVVYSDVTDLYPIEIGDGIGSNYLFNWTPGSIGSRLIAATAYDSTGASTTSVPITIEVKSPGQPTVTIASPNESSSVYLGQTIVVQADASAAAPGQVIEVDFYDGGRYLGSSYPAPFTANWTPDTLGSHTLTADVYDSFNQYATTSISVSVIDTPPLAVSFLQPLAGSYLQVSQPTTLVTGIGDLIGTLDGVQFYVNGSSIGDGVSESATWTPPSVGDYQLQVHASSSGPNQEGDQIITVHVADLHPPVVQWNTPADGASFPTSSVIALQAQASDIDGNLASFQLQADGELLYDTAVSGGGGAASFTWDTAGPGWHSLVAVAADDTDQFGSAFIRVFLERPVRNDLLPPSSLTAEPLSSIGIHLSWVPSTSTDSTGTAIERRAGVNGVWEEIATVDATVTSYDDNALEPEHYYSYRVAALDAAGARSNYSGESCVTTKVQLPRYAVVDLGESLNSSFVALNLIDQHFLYAQAHGMASLAAVLDLTDADVMSIDEANNVLLKKRDTTSDGQTTIEYYFLWHPDGSSPDYIGDPGFRAFRLSRGGIVAGAIDRSTTAPSVADWIYTGLEFWLGTGSYPGTMNAERIDVRAATWTPAGGVQEVTPSDEHEYRYDRLDINPARMLPRPFDSLYSAWDVSDEGTITGTGSWSDLRYVSPTTALESIEDYRPLTFQHGMRWKNGQWDTLGSLRQQSSTEGESVATAINPLGTIVVGGSAAPDRVGDPLLPAHAMRSQMPFYFRPLEPSDPALEDLAPLGDGSYSWAWDLDAAGDAVGYSTKHQTDPISQSQAAYWAFGTTTALELENLGGTNAQFPEGYGYANAINAAGDRTVGKSLTAEQFSAGTLWALNANKGGNDRWWEANDLNKQVPSDWYLVDAIDINNNGLIVGTAYHTVPDPANPNGPPIQIRRSVLLIPVDFIEVTPKLKDEGGNEIENSDKPKLLPEKNELVKEPRPGQIPNVAYRNLKIRVPNQAAGDKIKWSMVAQFIPAGKTNPVFRGQWPEEHPNRFEANGSGSGTYQFTALTQAEAETAIDSNGETAVRINLPPIGFNAAAVKIEIEKYSGAIAQIDFEVPAVVVIDPGHGGPSSPDKVGGSSWNNAIAVPSGILEKTMTLDFGLLLQDRLQQLKQENQLNMRIYATRTIDRNLGLAARANIGRDQGADIFLSIHFNDSDRTARGTETHIDHTGNLNTAEDFALAQRINDAAYGAISAHDAGAVDRGAKDERGLDALSDPSFGNTVNFHPVRGALLEVEFIDVAVVDQLLNTGENHEQVRQDAMNAVADAILLDLRSNPESNGN